MSILTLPAMTADTECYDLILTVQGAGAGVIPTLPVNAHGITIARTSAGLYTLTFNEEPGPLFLGLSPAFGDPTPSAVAGWTAASGTFTKRSVGVKATLVFATANSLFAATDMAATSTCYLTLCFKLGVAKL